MTTAVGIAWALVRYPAWFRQLNEQSAKFLKAACALFSAGVDALSPVGKRSRTKDASVHGS